MRLEAKENIAVLRVLLGFSACVSEPAAGFQSGVVANRVSVGTLMNIKGYSHTLRSNYLSKENCWRAKEEGTWG